MLKWRCLLCASFLVQGETMWSVGEWNDWLSAVKRYMAKGVPAGLLRPRWFKGLSRA